MSGVNYLYIGTFTKDIYIYANNGTDDWTSSGAISTVGNPSFLIANKAGDRLYAVHELYDYDGQIGAVSAFRINVTNGNLTLLNSRESGGHGPTHLALDRTERVLLVTHYGSGSVDVFHVSDVDGSIGHQLFSTRPRSTAKAHMATFDPSNLYAIVVYLGLDDVLFYNLNIISGELNPVEVPLLNGSSNRILRATLPKGSGPRHLVYNKEGTHFYVLNEVASSIAVFSSNPPVHNGSFDLVQLLSTLPADYGVDSFGGEIAILPSVNGTDGTLIEASFKLFASGGEFPRHVLVDRTGEFLLVSNQNSGGVVQMSIDADTGELTPRQRLDIPSPACALIVHKLRTI